MFKWNLLQVVRNAEGGSGGGGESSGGDGAAAAAAAGGAAAGDAAKTDAGFTVAVDGTVPNADAPKEGDPATGDAKPKEGEEGAGKDVKDGKPEKKDEPVDLKPEDYKFVLPDGAEPDEAQANEFTAFAIENKVPPELAQKLVDFHAQVMSKQVKTWTDTVQAWGEQTRNDPEYGGAAYEQNMGIANRAIAEFAGPKFGEALRTYGWGNHPEFVRFAVNVGKALGAPTTEKGGGQANRGTEISLGQALYGNQ